jgi:NDP-sugar pyrophosphorylase family protein
VETSATSGLDALLLAAGFGTRLRPLTEQVPKALLPVCGAPLLEQHLERLGALGPRMIRRVVVNGHHLAGDISAYLHKRRDAGAPQPEGGVHFSHERQIRGTGGALVQAAEWLTSEAVVLLNADAYFTAPVAEAIDFHQRHRPAATLVLADSPVWPNVRVADGRVVGIVREGPVPGGLTFTGLHVLSREALALLPAAGFHDIRDTYDRLLAGGRLGAYVWSPARAAFADIGTPESYLAAHRLCVPVEGAPASHPALQGYGFIDPRATIGAGAAVIESVVLAGATVAPGITVRRAILGPGVTVTEPVGEELITTAGRRPITP